jgi:TetR/AcrR family transcriptional regulator, transcriptional repressor for nem operon
MGRAKGFDETEVLERAMQLFWSQGYEETPLPELLTAMGISRQSLYDTFGNKRALFLRTIEHYRATQLSHALELLGRDGSPRENIEAVLGFFADLAADARGRGCLVANALVEVAHRDPELASLLEGTLDLLRDGLRAALERAREHGEIPADRNPASLARALTNAMIGMAVTGKLRPGPDVIRDIHAGTLSMLG